MNLVYQSQLCSKPPPPLPSSPTPSARSKQNTPPVAPPPPSTTPSNIGQVSQATPTTTPNAAPTMADQVPSTSQSASVTNNPSYPQQATQASTTSIVQPSEKPRPAQKLNIFEKFYEEIAAHPDAQLDKTSPKATELQSLCSEVRKHVGHIAPVPNNRFIADGAGGWKINPKLDPKEKAQINCRSQDLILQTL